MYHKIKINNIEYNIPDLFDLSIIETNYKNRKNHLDNFNKWHYDNHDRWEYFINKNDSSKEIELTDIKIIKNNVLKQKIQNNLISLFVFQRHYTLDQFLHEFTKLIKTNKIQLEDIPLQFNNEIINLKPFQINSITFLTLINNGINKIHNFPILPNIYILQIICNNLKIIPNLSKNLSNITLLEISKCNISDIHPQLYLPRLKSLILSENLINDFKKIPSFPNLKNLSLNSNQLTSFSNFPNLPKLTTLILKNNNITSLYGIPIPKTQSNSKSLCYNQDNEIEKLNQNECIEINCDYNQITNLYGLPPILDDNIEISLIGNPFNTLYGITMTNIHAIKLFHEIYTIDEDISEMTLPPIIESKIKFAFITDDEMYSVLDENDNILPVYEDELDYDVIKPEQRKEAQEYICAYYKYPIHTIASKPIISDIEFDRLKIEYDETIYRLLENNYLTNFHNKKLSESQIQMKNKIISLLEEIKNDYSVKVINFNKQISLDGTIML